MKRGYIISFVVLLSLSVFRLFAQVDIGGVINKYAAVTAINNSTFSFTVESGKGALFPTCNKVLIIQMKGATINETESASFGNVSSIGNAGNYEIRTVSSVTGDVVTFSGLTNTYNVSGKVQLIPVPEYLTGANITSVLTCAPWDGSRGGVLIFEASTLAMNAAIDVSGMGFRSGKNNSGNVDLCVVSEFTDSRSSMLYRSPSTSKSGAEKGEGIAESSYLFSIGKLASGGGGGGLHNGSGGGGSNYGQGGSGGTGSNNCNGSIPANGKGQGGLKLDTYIQSGKVFLGGGGGAGQGNNNSSSPSWPNANNDLNHGGAGGGIVIIKATEVITTWTGNVFPRDNATISILANGLGAPNKTDAPQNTVYYDGAGGGGAGGSILLDVGTINISTGNKQIEIEAYGGRGGDTQSNQDCYAPGGGGGGGAVIFSSATAPVGVKTVNVAGGVKGVMLGGQETTTPCQVSKQNTDGIAGSVIYGSTNFKFPLCCTPATITKQPKDSTVCQGNAAAFGVTASSATLTYQWYVKTSSSATWTAITNTGVYTTETTKDLTITGATALMNGYQYKVEIKNNNACPIESDVVTLVVSTKPVANITTTALSYCAGTGGVSLSAAANTALTGATYAWYEWNGTAKTGVALATGQAPAIYKFTGTKDYVVEVTNGACVEISTAKKVTVSTAPSLTITNPSAVCSPSTVDVTATAVTAGSTNAGTLSYWTNTAGTTPLTTPTAVATANTYYIKGTNATNAACSDIKPVVVAIDAKPSLTITNPAAVCSPNTVNITAAAVTAGSTNAGTLSYWTNPTGTTPLTNPAAVATANTYYIKGTNAACTDIKPVVVAIDAKPSLTITNPAAVCSPSTVDITATVVTAGSTNAGTLSYWTNTAGTTPLTTPAAVATANTYYIKGTNAANAACTDIKPVVVSIDTKPSLTITNPTAVCSPSTVNITATAVTAGSTNAGTLSYWTNVAGTTPLTTPAAVATANTYYIKGTNATNAACTDIKAVVVAINQLPEGSMTIDKTLICNDNIDQATVTFSASNGKSPYTISYTQAGTTKQLTAVASSSTVTTKLAETFAITDVTDANNCAATNLGTQTNVATNNLEQPVVLKKHYECNSFNPTGGIAGTYTYRMILEVDKGDVPTYAIQGTFGATATTGAFTSKVWTSAWVTEKVGDDFNVSLTDKNNCNPLTITGDTVCSCAETANLAVVTGSPNKLCVQGTPTQTNLEITFNANGTGATSYDFVVNKDGNPIQTVTGHTAGIYSITNQGAGTYSITGFKGTCTGSTNTLKIDAYTSPTGTINAVDAALCKGVDNANIELLGGQGSGPWVFTVSGTDYTTTAGKASITPSAGGTFTVTSITDANGCTASATELTAKAVTIKEVTPPTVTITAPTVLPSLVGTDNTNLEVIDLGADYTTTWGINSGQGALGTPSAATTTLTGLTAKDPAANSTTNITVSIEDKDKVCPKEEKTFDVTRVDKTVPVDDSVTVCAGTTAELKIPPSIIKTIETESLSIPSGIIATINSTTRKVDVPTTGVPSGRYVIVYEVKNSVSNTTSTANLIVKIDEPVGNVSLITTPINTCANQVNLQAAVPTPVTAVGTWTIDTQPSTQTASIASPNDANAVIAGLSVGQTTVKWQVTNGVCPADSKTQTINQVGKITSPSISVTGATATGTDTYKLCVGQTVNLEANVPLATGETGEWKVGFTGNTATQSYTGVVGTTSFTATWEISTLVPGCNAESKVVSFTINDVPQGGNITITDQCEGLTIPVTVSGVTNATSYTWSGTNATQTPTSTSATASFLLSTTATTYSVATIPKNECGDGTVVTASANINLKPKTVPVINGFATVCGTKSYTYTYVPTTDAATFTWKWKGTDKGATPSITLSGTDLISSGKLTLEPSNQCGKGPLGELDLTVQSQTAPQVAIRFKDNELKACEDEDNLELEVNTTFSNGGTGATYEFFKGTTSLGTSATSTTMSVAQGTWVDKDNFSVKMIPDAATGCFTGGSNPVTSAPITVDGYKNPSVTLTSNKVAICETDGEITLTIGAMKKGDVVNTWKKDNALLIGSTGTTYKAGQSEQRGTYEVEVGNAVCSGTDTKSTAIRIYEQPTIVNFFKAIDKTPIALNGRYVYSIQESGSIASDIVPTAITGIVADEATTTYVWSAPTISIEQNKVDMNFTKEGETEGLEWVSLVVLNGELGAICKDSAGFNMGISLPLIVPNAFSPNGDQINDRWVIQGMNDFPDAQMTIFNRWGAKLYEKFGGYPADKAWDGEGLPVGTYYYILKLNDPVRKADGIDDVVRGAITITR